MRALTYGIAVAVLLVFAACSGERPVEEDLEFHAAPVIVISIDTLRADHLPAWGYRGVETPAIEALRADGVLFRNAYSHVPLTLPSHVSILTGQLPFESGVRDNVGYRFDATSDSLPVTLKREGYATGAAVSAYVLRGSTGLGAAFDQYDDAVSGAMNVGVGQVSRPGGATVDAAERWLAARDGRPFFFLLHLFEPHTPYAPPEPFRSRYRAPYDGEIAAADALVGRFLDLLKRSGVYDRAIIVLLSDHGEGLGDHGESEHGIFLYREALHVPLIVKLPGSAKKGNVIDRPVQLIDIAPTIASLVGARPKTPYAGVSLFGEAPAGRVAYSETMYPQLHFGWSSLRSLIDERHHFIEAPSQELYDLERDPAERSNVASSERRTLSRLRDQLGKYPAAVASPAAVDPETARKLASLGYIGAVRASGGAGEDPKEAIGQLEELRRIASLEVEGKLAEAAGAYEKLGQQHPALSEAWQRLAALEERRENFSAAFAAYRRAIEAAPTLAPPVAASIGSVLLQLGRYDEARQHADLAMQITPGAAHHLLGRIALAQRDLAAAQREAQLAMEDTSWRGPAAVLMAVTLSEQGRRDEALALLDRVGSEYASVGPVRDLQSTRGDLLARADRFDEAVQAFRAEVSAFPGNSAGYTRLALLYIAAGQPQKAKDALEEMVRLTPTRRSLLLAADVWRTVANGAEASRWRARAARAR